MATSIERSLTQACPAYIDCKAPIDIILQSSDGKQFGTHKSYLGIYSGGFPSADMPTPNATSSVLEIVELEEMEDVVYLLLQFMHPECPPSTIPLHDDLIIRFSEAVGKYIVYGAIECCKLRMRDVASRNALQAFMFSIKHGDSYLRNYVAPLTLGISMDVVRPALARAQFSPAFIAWVRYKDTSDSLIKALNTVRSLETNETSKSTGPRNVNAKNPGGQLKRARRTRDSLMTVTFESIYEEELRLACSE